MRAKLCTVRVERQRSDDLESATITVKALAPDICILLEVETENESGWSWMKVQQGVRVRITAYKESVELLGCSHGLRPYGLVIVYMAYEAR